MAGQISVDLLEAAEDDDEIAGFARMVSTVLKSRNLTLEQLAESIQRPLPMRRDHQILLAQGAVLAGVSDGFT
jgi:hypothetical protein